MSRSTLSSRIDEMYSVTVGEVVKKLEKAPYLCLTADAWSAHSRAFLGVTSHWIDGDLKRGSAVLACSRFTGTHSYDRIAVELNKIIARFNIPKEKIVCVVTDNGSNFVKAFKEFGLDAVKESRKPKEPHSSDSGGESDDVSEEESEADSSESLDEMVVEIDQILHAKSSLELPSHFRCASHTLSLIATKDILEVSLNAFKTLPYEIQRVAD